MIDSDDDGPSPRVEVDFSTGKSKTTGFKVNEMNESQPPDQDSRSSLGKEDRIEHVYWITQYLSVIRNSFQQLPYKGLSRNNKGMKDIMPAAQSEYLTSSWHLRFGLRTGR